jgi:hypothetical protein
VASWINDVWDKIAMSCIKKMWISVGHFIPDEFGDLAVTQSEEVASIPPIFGVSHDDSREEDSREE